MPTDNVTEMILDSLDRIESNVNQINTTVQQLAVSQATYATKLEALKDKVEDIEACQDEHADKLGLLARVGWKVNLMWGGLGVLGTGVIGMLIKACI